jgi:hypothetical protein
MTPQSASGALAGYMGANGNSTLDPNALYQLSLGQSVGGKGQTPSPDVQQAAQYMLANPQVYKQIETHDVGGADGISGMANFQNAAQGDFPISAPATSNAGQTPGLPQAGGAGGMGKDAASGALAGYMGTNGNQALNVNDLYQLALGNAAGGKGQTPSPDVQQAAQYMLANPKQYEKIETHDVAGADGIAGINDFEDGAQGLA